jgi:hypothetical protein
MRHVIFTACDKKYGDFLINHWYRSLKENVELSNIDVVVLDYGLSDAQRRKLRNSVILHKCKRDGHVTTIRFRDMFTYLSGHVYDQVLSIDGGDIIFQADISQLFEKDKTYFRGVYEVYNQFIKIYATSLFFEKEIAAQIKNSLKDRSILNAGVVIGPYKKFLSLCEEYTRIIKDTTKYGPDQAAVHYIVHREGLKPLESKYNFILTTGKDKFKIKNSKFYNEDGELIPIVHNGGQLDQLRPIKNFGYGPKYNKLRPVVYRSLRWVHKFAKDIAEH